MKKLIVSIALIIASAHINAQIKISTGDAELDKSLTELNNDAKNALDIFKKDVVNQFNVAANVVEDLLNIHKMEPADVVMSLQIAQISNQPVAQVANVYDKSKTKGWGEMAKEMGIKPGSKEFHELKDKAKGKSKEMKGKGKEKSHEHGGGNGKGKGKK